MKTIVITAAILALGTGACQAQPQDSAPTAYAATADAARPEADRARDDLRKPDAMLAFAGVESGQSIAELIPGGGYFTRIFSGAVGTEGRVYAIIPPANPERPPAVRAIAADGAYANLTVIEGPLADFTVPAPVDLVWTSQNYHDVPEASRAALNTAVFNALKPGGVYIVLDHSAAPGTGPTNTLHRMDEQVVRDQVAAAGFEFVEASDALANPDDDRSVAVFDGATRGHTDQFILKFRKPS